MMRAWPPATTSMLSRQAIVVVVVVLLVLFFVGGRSRCEAETLETASLHVDYSVARRMPDTLFGLFFEEINHAGSGGLWAELVSNRAHGYDLSLSLSLLLNDSLLPPPSPYLHLHHLRCFSRPDPPPPHPPHRRRHPTASIYRPRPPLPVYAAPMNCSSLHNPPIPRQIHSTAPPQPNTLIHSPSVSPAAGEESQKEEEEAHRRRDARDSPATSFWLGVVLKLEPTHQTLTHGPSLSQNPVAVRIEVVCDDCPACGVGIYNPGFWGMNVEEGKTYNLVMHIRSLESVELTASLTCSNGSQNLASNSLLAHGTCRTSRLELTTRRRGVIWLDQVSLIPSETYKGHGFRQELMWKETIGPWEERPGHYGDVWHYWTDDGLGYYEFLQLAEDLGAAPVWVLNIGMSHSDVVNGTMLAPFVKDAIDSLEFARGSKESTWGSSRDGTPEPFPLKYVALGNEDCEIFKPTYQENYPKFYNAIREAYPDIQIISNCDGSSRPLDHPADLYDFHIYTNASALFHMKNEFDRTSRNGPKVFVSEYAVNNDKGGDAGNGSLLASLAEAAFLTGLEKNSWNPDAIVFNSWQQYGTPSYWMQTYFRESSGSAIHPVTISSSYFDLLAASAITWQDNEDIFLRVKIVNFGPSAVNLTISSSGLQAGVNAAKSTVTVLTSSNLLDENSFSEPNKVVPVTRELLNAAQEMQFLLLPFSLTSFDLAMF
uniref:non-reducing end alpha-L-arabinofuranosidase n=1 Tax=Oryza meridionalis TaxID=40149 RepID=A0A0E0F258_9ORYZ